MASPPIYNPVVPCVHPVPGGLFPGRMIRVQGNVPPGGQRFAINLQCGPNTDPRDDIALHLNFRFVEMCVVRNHLTAMNWGVEETAGGMPLVRGEAFEALLLCDPQSIKVALNGAHFCEFPHRVPFQRISHITVDGDVHIQFIGFEGAQAPPQQQMYMQSEQPPSYAYGAPPPAYGAPGYGAPQGFGGQMPPQQYAGGVAPPQQYAGGVVPPQQYAGGVAPQQQRRGMGTGAAIGLGAGALAAGGLAGYAMGGGFNSNTPSDVNPYQDPVSASSVPPVPVDWYDNTNQDSANQNPNAPAPPTPVVQGDPTQAATTPEAAPTAPEEPLVDDVDENPPVTEPEPTEDADDDYLTQDPVEDPPEENPPVTEPEPTEDADDDYLTQDPVEDPPEEVETADIGDFGGDDDWMD